MAGLSGCFCAIADRGDGEGLRLTLDRGVFWEFVPVAQLDAPSPTRHWAATIEPGVDYAVVVTSCAGLWGYVLGDTVRFLSRDPPRLLAAALDARLMSGNDDYATHRHAGQLAAPAVVLLPEGRFAAWMRRTGRLGGQNKVPRAIAEPGRFAAAMRGLMEP